MKSNSMKSVKFAVLFRQGIAFLMHVVLASRAKARGVFTAVKVTLRFHHEPNHHRVEEKVDCRVENINWL